MTAVPGRDDEDLILCRCYTKARRHPKVIGTVQGHRLPFGLILWTSQLGVLVVSFVVLMWTRGLWGRVLSAGPEQLAVIVVIPGFLTWAVRKARMEGRSPMQMLTGLAAYLARRSTGVEIAGHAVRENRPRPVRGGRLYVVAEPAHLDRRLAR